MDKCKRVDGIRNEGAAARGARMTMRAAIKSTRRRSTGPVPRIASKFSACSFHCRLPALS